MVKIDEAALAASLRRLADRGSDEAIASALKEVTEACVALFEVRGSGIMIADEQNATRYIASSDSHGRHLERFEAEHSEGPCTDAFVHGTTVATSDLSTDSRWPALRAAMTGEPIRAVLGLPLRLGGVIVGTMDVYRDHPYEWDDSERAALNRFATVVESTLRAAVAAHHASEVAVQLQYALDYRVVIERGVGFLMGSEHLNDVAAFNRLRTAARSSRRKIGDVATELLKTGRLPGS